MMYLFVIEGMECLIRALKTNKVNIKKARSIVQSYLDNVVKVNGLQQYDSTYNNNKEDLFVQIYEQGL